MIRWPKPDLPPINLWNAPKDNVMHNYQPKGSQCTACKHRNGPCSHLPFHEMPVCERLPDGTRVVICREFERRVAK